MFRCGIGQRLTKETTSLVTTPPQQPQQPGYGAPFGGPPPQGPPPPPPYGYPQQQVPYGQQQPGGWGGPPPGGPPKSGNYQAGLIIGGLVVAFCVVAGLIGVAGGFDSAESASGGSSGDPSYAPRPGYEVTLPKTLENGKFELAKDMSEQASSTLGSDEEGVMGAYGSTDGTEALLFSGVNSDRAGSSESETGGSILNGMEKNGDVSVAVPRRQITPAGAEDALSCEVLTKSQAGKELTVKACAWTDDGSSAAVLDDSPGSWTEPPAKVDLDAFAARVDTMRDEVRRPSAGTRS